MFAMQKRKTLLPLQLNLWHGCTKVPNGDQGIIDVLDQMDADVVFLCEIRDGKQFIPHVIENYGEGREENITMVKRLILQSVFRVNSGPDIGPNAASYLVTKVVLW